MISTFVFINLLIVDIAPGKNWGKLILPTRSVRLGPETENAEQQHVSEPEHPARREQVEQVEQVSCWIRRRRLGRGGCRQDRGAARSWFWKIAAACRAGQVVYRDLARLRREVASVRRDLDREVGTARGDLLAASGELGEGEGVPVRGAGKGETGAFLRDLGGTSSLVRVAATGEAVARAQAALLRARELDRLNRLRQERQEEDLKQMFALLKADSSLPDRRSSCSPAHSAPGTAPDGSWSGTTTGGGDSRGEGRYGQRLLPLHSGLRHQGRQEGRGALAASAPAAAVGV